jgi:hypothetical protein
MLRAALYCCAIGSGVLLDCAGWAVMGCVAGLCWAVLLWAVLVCGWAARCVLVCIFLPFPPGQRSAQGGPQCFCSLP